MTNPAIYANGTSSLATFFAPSGLGDGPRLVVRTAAIPATTSVATIIGLIPFQKGALMGPASVYFDDLDTGSTVTVNWGYIYTANDTVTNINSTAAFAAGATTPQAGGKLSETSTSATAAQWVATSPGWITLDIAAGPTTQTGNATFKGTISYQG